MKGQLVTLLILVTLTTSQTQYPTFAQYVQQFSKIYTADEYALRQSIYNKNIKELYQITDYTPGVNQMTDWSDQEIKQRKNLLRQPSSTRLARPLPLKSRLGYPASVDWRALNAVTSIKYQGCGDCWAFATAAYAESKLIIDKRFNNTNIDLSEQYLDSCTSSSDCTGGYLEYAMKVGLKLPSETVYPYNASYQSRAICSNAKRLEIAKSNSDYYTVSDSGLISLLQSGPVVISISADDWEKYSSGVFKCATTAQVNHAVLLVGYTDSYWIIKNQWGALWGMSGFMYLTRQRAYNCQVGQSAHIMTGMGDTSYDKYFLVGVDTNNQSFTPVNNNTSNTVATNNSTSTTLSGKWILSACLLLLLALLI